MADQRERRVKGPTESEQEQITQIDSFISTLSEDNFTSNQRSILEVLDSVPNDVRIYQHYIRALMIQCKPCLASKDDSHHDSSTLLVFRLLAQEIQRVARDPTLADKFRFAVNFRDFIVSRLIDRVGLQPLERLIIAASFMGSMQKLPIVYASRIIHAIIDAAIVQLCLTPAFQNGADLSLDGAIKLLSNLFSPHNYGDDFLSYARCMALVEATLHKYGFQAVAHVCAHESHLHAELEYGLANTPDLVQQWLDTYPRHRFRPEGIQKLLGFFTTNNEDLPSALFIDGVTQTIQGALPVAGGSFADVFRGIYQGQEIAVKRLRLFVNHDDAKREKFYKRFYREALIWRQLRHEHLVPFLGLDRDVLKSGIPSMIAPWMTQGTLSEYLKREHVQLDHKSIIMDVVAGLRHLHGRSFVHGDIHGSNVFINEHNRALLGDFGLTALAYPTYIAPTTTINKAGAVRWISPELLESKDGNQPPKTTMGDIFAFGRICLTVYTRLQPFHALVSDMYVVSKVITHEDPPRPTKDECHGTEMPDELWSLVCRCWLADPEARPDIHDVFYKINYSPF